MRFMVLVPGGPESESGEMPPREALEAMTRYNLQLAEAGVLLAADGLHPTCRGAKVRFEGECPTVICSSRTRPRRSMRLRTTCCG